MKIDLYSDKVFTPNKLALIKSAIVLNGSDFNPPHVGLLLNNMYFSSTANGLKINVPFEHIFNAFKRRKHKVIIASTNINIDLPLALEIFKQHDFLGVNYSCYKPVKVYFEKSLNTLFDATYVYQLLPILVNQHILLDFHHHGFNVEGHKKSIVLPRYSEKEILNCIDKERSHFDRNAEISVH